MKHEKLLDILVNLKASGVEELEAFKKGFDDIDKSIVGNKRQIEELKAEYEKFAKDRRRSIETISAEKKKTQEKIRTHREDIANLRVQKDEMKDMISSSKNNIQSIQSQISGEEKLSASRDKNITDMVDRTIGGTELRESQAQWKTYYKEVERGAKENVRNLEKQKKESRRFRGEYLSLMFAGMAMASAFQGPINQMMEMFGITEMLGIVFQTFLIPVFVALMPYIVDLFQWIMNLSPETKTFIGVMMILTFVLGSLLAFVGMAVLAFSGLAAIIGGGTTIAGAALFAGKILAIVGVIILLVTHFQIVRDLIVVGFQLMLLPLNSLIIGLQTVIGLWDVLTGKASLGDVRNQMMESAKNKIPGAGILIGSLSQTINNDNTISSGTDVDLLTRSQRDTQQGFLSQMAGVVGI